MRSSVELERKVSLDARQLLGWPLPAEPPAGVDAWRELVTRFAHARVNWALLEPLLTFSKRGYTRLQLAANEAWELLLLGWLPGQASAVHGHGGSSGATRVLLGRLLETQFELEHGRVRPILHRTLAESQTITEGLRTIHRITNGSDQPALSLHLYSPPLAELVEYEPLPVTTEEYELHAP